MYYFLIKCIEILSAQMQSAYNNPQTPKLHLTFIVIHNFISFYNRHIYVLMDIIIKTYTTFMDVKYGIIFMTNFLSFQRLIRQPRSNSYSFK